MRLGLLARRVLKGRRVFRVLPGWVLGFVVRLRRSMTSRPLPPKAIFTTSRLLNRRLAGRGMTRIRLGLMRGRFRVRRVLRGLSVLLGLLARRVSRVSLVLMVLRVLLVLLARRVRLVFRVLLVWMGHRALMVLWVLRDLRAIRVFLVRPVLRALTVP